MCQIMNIHTGMCELFYLVAFCSASVFKSIFAKLSVMKDKFSALPGFTELGSSSHRHRHVQYVVYHTEPFNTIEKPLDAFI